MEGVEVFEFLVVIHVPVLGQPFGDVLIRHGDMIFTSKSLGLLKPGIGIPGLGFVVMASPECLPFRESSFSVLSTSVPEGVVVSQEEVELISFKMSLELVHNLIPGH